jgi:hypothetical protein
MMRLAVFILLAFFAALALAQLRTIPNDAVLGVMRHLEAMVVELDGQAVALAPGAQIRDPDNRIVLPASLNGTLLVRYLVDASGMVQQVWILSAREKAALPPDPIPK